MPRPSSWSSPVLASRTLVGFPDGQMEDAPVHPACVAAQPLFYASWDLAIGPLALETKEYPDKGTAPVFGGGHPSYLPQGKVKNISYGCGPSGHLACPFNIVPVHRDKQTGSERGVMSHRCVEAALPSPNHVSAPPAG